MSNATIQQLNDQVSALNASYNADPVALQYLRR